MKKVANILMLLVVLMFSFPMIESGSNHLTNVIVGAVAFALVVLHLVFGKKQTGNAVMSDVALNRVVIAELLKQFKDLKDDFMGTLRSMDDKVNNDVIDFNEIGAPPDVLVDNTIYPIASAQRTDTKRPVSLFKLETENTTITDDELRALPYDKKSSVMEQHKDALKLASIRLGLYSLAPAGDGANTPVIKTSGVNADGRLRLTTADIILLKDRADTLMIPLESRKLVLSSKHVNDLLLIDQSFKDRYYSTETGKMIANISGFQIFESLHNPTFNGDAKVAYGAAAAEGDQYASTFFSNQNAMKATGSLSMYASLASADPEMRESKIGFRMYHIVSLINAKGAGAIIDTIGADVP